MTMTPGVPRVGAVPYGRRTSSTIAAHTRAVRGAYKAWRGVVAWRGRGGPAGARLPAGHHAHNASAWIDAALDLLAEAGVDGVRVEILAKVLGVTKGGFYWHFKDRDALLESVLAEWRRRATLAIIVRLEKHVDLPMDRLKRLLRIPFGGPRAEWGAGVELSLRVWGRRDRRARATLQEVDQLRLQYIQNLLISCGVSKSEATARAIAAYSYMRVAGTLINSRQTEIIAQIESVLIGPRGLDLYSGRPDA